MINKGRHRPKNGVSIVNVSKEFKKIIDTSFEYSYWFFPPYK